MNCKAVIGLGFGDEGKGLVTDYLCSKEHNALVVRFSGGHQVGHTVVRNGVSHVFSNFGAGTLLGIPTYWSQYCTIEPIGLLNELEMLLSKGANPQLIINENCPITTPFDILQNQKLEEKNQHGSCGVGFGATLLRTISGCNLTFKDLYHPHVLPLKLDAIKNVYGITDQISLESFYNSVYAIINSDFVNISETIPQEFECIIFEGAQGLLLDQNIGFFPHVTRSNTGSKNFVELGYSPELFLVTRCYQTRHGNGPMTNQNIPHNITLNPNETNLTNHFQGEFRRSLLDLNLLLYGISRDKYINQNKDNIVITCLDHITNEYRFTYNGNIIYATNETDFIIKINSILGFKNVYISKSADANKGITQVIKC